MKYQPSPIAGTMSGSAGSLVASRNRSGAYFRTRVQPVNPNTTRQQDIRAAFGSMVQAWISVLTQAQRDAWKQYGDQVTVLDALGNAIKLTGQNWYVGNNSARLGAGLTRVDTAPTIFDTGESITSLFTINNATENEIGVDTASISNDVNLQAPASDDGDLLVYLGPPINATRDYYKGPYQLTDVLAVAATDTSVAWGTAITSLQNGNGTVAIGQTRGLRMRVAYDDGRLSQPFSLVAPVVDDPV